MTFFLFDASVNAFRPGGSGGSLGYAQYYTTPGMAKGYMGISIDEFGNFSSATDGTKNGGPGQQRGSVAIRGPGNGRSATDYVYQTGVIASDPAFNAGFQGFTQRYPDSTQANYRRMKIIMTPGSSAGTATGYKITVIMYKGGTPVTPVTLINNFDYPFAAPNKLQFGLSGSTGAITNIHEIRNLNINVTNETALVPPSLSNDAGASACQGQQVLIDVTANDHSNNSGGAMNKETIDLDPLTAGQQTTFTDPGKGTYSVNTLGIVSFTAVSGYAGTSAITYLADDNYGKTATTPATINVNVDNSAAPVLAVTDPVPVCAPATVNLANPLLITASGGSAFSYFSTLTDANNNTNNINATAGTLNQPGTYYIRASLNGCATVKPVIVNISSAPTVANAGSDQSFCSSVGSQTATLLANNPDIGIGTWTQLSGPSSASITYPNAATSPVSAMNKGVYVFRWSITNGSCAISTDDIQVNVGIAANAGTNQTIVNATSATLAANSASPATGIWSLVSGPAVTITNPSNPATTVTGLVAGNTYVFSWRITNGACVSSSQVTITDVLNTVANAGPDRTRTVLSAFNLEGNTPGTGNTGTWSVVSAPLGTVPVIFSPSNPQSAVLGVSLYGSYTLRWTITNGSFSNSDDVTFFMNAVLPVKMISFTGKMDNDVCKLKWETASENDNAYFDIERSIDGQTFSKVGRVTGSGTTEYTHGYQFSDEISELPGGPVYYRLKQVDRDGNINFSEIIKVVITLKNSLIILSNPFDAQLRIRGHFAHQAPIKITLLNYAGRPVKQLAEKSTVGINHFNLDNLSAIAKGVYIIMIQTGSNVQAFKVIKK